MGDDLGAADAAWPDEQLRAAATTDLEQALALGLRKLDGPPLSLWEKVQDLVLDRLVRDKVRARFGGKLIAMVSGGVICAVVMVLLGWRLTALRRWTLADAETGAPSTPTPDKSE